ncbi:peptidoglycan-binding protein [Nitrosococcus watsonii]|uniref:Peptidoglycan-binding domain 1 protein n=1 Tax=Nitrosococcus watsoni (strain C-113) TaxID=105559 RepID=D8K9K5_NITWC|nr:peptidoglycan-binding protein [Nitrosococcus watsonii]ADJ27294.1 Peptidoglycan-binding domain 1 protein [Nitrosococcus watsonii C-113]
MNTAFDFEEEPLEGLMEFGQEIFDAELADLEGEEEFWRGRRTPGHVLARRQRPLRLRRPLPSRPSKRFPARPVATRPQPPKRPPPQPRFPHRPAIIRRRIVPEPVPCVCPAHGTEFIRWVQSSLNQILGSRLPVSGVMNRGTRDALRQFQKQQGLPVDGIAGPPTERALLDALGGGVRDDAAGMAKPSDATESAADSELFEYDAEELEAPLARPMLGRGSRGASVIELQKRLSALGFNPGAADGIFGSRTESAVRAFQHSQRITVDGIVGPQTWSRLYGPTPSPVPSPPSGTTSVTWKLPPEIRAAGDAQTVRYDSPPPWANGANCTRYTDGAAELRRYIKATFPGVRLIGGYSCRANSATPSETSVHGVGRALDIMIPTVGGRANSAVGDPIANWLVRNATAIGVQYIIWNRVRWSGSRTPHVADYGGPNPHIDHIHVELNLDGARRRTAWFQERETVTAYSELAEEFESLWESEINRSSTDHVRWIQQSLNKIMGLRLAVDGILGPMTRSAVRSFQSRHRLAVDGIVGPHTERALVAAGADSPPFIPAAGGAQDIVNVRGIQVARQIQPQIAALLATADADGIHLSGSGYRSSARQIGLRRQNCGPTYDDIWKKSPSQCRPPTAIPGRSLHEKGLAIDFRYNGQGITSRSSPGFIWLSQNAGQFGLKNLPSEPWHWSTTGA